MLRSFLLIDVILVAIVLFSLGVFPPDWVVLISYLFLIGYLIHTRRTNLFQHLTVATVIALIWAVLGRGEYGYNQTFLSVFGVNFFPLFGWAAGLFAAYLLFSHQEQKHHAKGFQHQMAVFVAIFWPLLIFAETIAYHAFNIRNIAAADYPGLPICDCMHAPPYMQAVYFLMGPLYFMICWKLRLERQTGLKSLGNLEPPGNLEPSGNLDSQGL